MNYIKNKITTTIHLLCWTVLDYILLKDLCMVMFHSAVLFAELAPHGVRVNSVE